MHFCLSQSSAAAVVVNDMVYIGIVGAGADKFTPETEAQAKAKILELLSADGSILVSGHAPVGGIDIWAEEIADRLGIEKRIFAPAIHQWNPPGGYGFKARNLDIAKASDVVYNIVAREYPPGYRGMRFNLCYHCKKTDHLKSGGCWTAIQAKRLWRQAYWIII